VRKANAKAKIFGARAYEWNNQRHFLKIYTYLEGLMRVMHDCLHDAKDFDMFHKSVALFMHYLAVSFKDGSEFPRDAQLLGGGARMNIKRALYGAWLKMWKGILDGHGVEGSWERTSTDMYQSLYSHFAQAILYAWPSSAKRARAQSIVVNFYVGTRLPADMQMTFLAQDSLFQVLDTKPVLIDGWAYTRVRCAPTPNTPVVEYITRYRPDADVDAEGFQVLAKKVGTAYQPSAAGSVTYAQAWQAILSRTAPAPYTSFNTFLNDLVIGGLVQVGGPQSTLSWVDRLLALA
jgi:hypothetical protein